MSKDTVSGCNNAKIMVWKSIVNEPVMKRDSIMAFVIDGKSYDLGNAKAYREDLSGMDRGLMI